MVYMCIFMLCCSFVLIKTSQYIQTHRGSVGAPDPKMLDKIARGKASPIPYSVVGTRHLVLLLQGLLISVSGAVRDSMWLDRKTKCDVLLQMCGALALISHH